MLRSNNYSKNYRGKIFRSKNLTGHDFSDADIQGADFTEAILVDTNFSHAKAGLQHRWVIFGLIISSFLSALLGFTSVLAAFIATYWLTPEAIQEYTLIPGLIMSGLLAIFFATTVVGKNPVMGLGSVAVAGFAVLVLTGTRTEFVIVSALAGAGIFGFLAWVGLGAMAVALAIAVAGTVGIVPVIAGWLGAITVAINWSVSEDAARTIVKALGGGVPTGIWSLAVTMAGLVALTGGYIGWRGMKGDSQYALVRQQAIEISAIKNTRFYRANLTNADFTRAKVHSTDFRQAILKHTCWYKTQGLDQARVEGTYLQNPQIRQLLTTFQGENTNFDYQLDLRGVNLRGAKLKKASFIGADLSEADLHAADLSGAKLVQTQLDRTDLTNACLTGAYIEDWHITNKTKLEGIKCRYVYMHLRTEEDPDPCRKPDNQQEEFGEGEFADFIAPLIDTLDFYHAENVDLYASIIAFKRLSEKHPEAGLGILAMSKRGKNLFVLQAKTSPYADHSQLHEEYSYEYNSEYNPHRALPIKTKKLQLLLCLPEIDRQTQILEALAKDAINPNNSTQILNANRDISALNLKNNYGKNGENNSSNKNK